MLEMRKVVLILEPADLLALEGIIMDEDRKEALNFLRKKVYSRLLQEGQGGCGHQKCCGGV